MQKKLMPFKYLFILILAIAAYLFYLDFKNLREPKKIVITEQKIDTLVKYKEVIKTRLQSRIDTIERIKNDTTIVLEDCSDSVKYYEGLINYYEPALTDAISVIETQDSIISLKDTVIVELKKQPKNKLKVWQVVGLIGVGFGASKVLSK